MGEVAWLRGGKKNMALKNKEFSLRTEDGTSEVLADLKKKCNLCEKKFLIRE